MTSIDDLPADDLEKMEALRDVMDHAVRFTRATSLARELRTWALRPLVLAAIAVPLLLVTIYAHAVHADWVFGADPAKAPAAQRQAHLRYAMFLSAQRVADYRASHGSLPSTLEEAGDAWPEIEYSARDSTFTLTAVDGDERIAFRSDQDARAFLGTSTRFLRDQRP